MPDTPKNPTNIPKLVRMEKLNRDVGAIIGQTIKESGDGFGFALLMFSWGDDPELTWISNAERRPMIEVLKEFIDMLEKDKADELGKKDRWNTRQN